MTLNLFQRSALTVGFDGRFFYVFLSRQNFLNQGEAVSSRCDELQSLLTRGCNLTDIENPRGGQHIIQDTPMTNRVKGEDKLKLENITQIQPQKLSLTLRAGEGPSANRWIINVKNDDDAYI